MYLYKRTFEAKTAKDDKMKALLNQNSVTSEYIPSYKWAVKYMSEDLVNYEHCFINKNEAVNYAKKCGRELYA